MTSFTLMEYKAFSLIFWTSNHISLEVRVNKLSAQRQFERLHEWDTISWKEMNVGSNSKNGYDEDVTLNMFIDIVLGNMNPYGVFFTNVLNACTILTYLGCEK